MIEEVKDGSLVERKKKVKKSKEKKLEANPEEKKNDDLLESKKKAKKRKKSETTEELNQLEDTGEVKKEKKSKFKISLNADGCEPPVPVKAKKPFWAPGKGPKILIAKGENEETAAKRKKKEKDKKRKKKGEEARVHETQGHNKAVRYLTSWAEDRQNWKFEKCRQIWLIQNCYDPLKIPDAIFPTLVDYMNSIRGKMREVALERAKEKVAKGEAQLEVTEAGKVDEEQEKVIDEENTEKEAEEGDKPSKEEEGDKPSKEEEGDKTSEAAPKKKKKEKKKKEPVVAKKELISEAELKRATQIVEMLLE